MKTGNPERMPQRNWETRVKQVRSGIIGTGFIGGVHARAVKAAGGVLVSVADVSPEAAAESMHRLDAQRFAASAADLISADDIDVVHICTPNYLHDSLAQLAIAAGKHVICEKPLATETSSAARLVQEAKAAGVVTAVPFVYRFYPSVRDARQRVRTGETGPLRVLHGSYLQDWLVSTEDTNWRVDPALGGSSRAFGDIGVHWCDLIEFVSGHRIVRLTARLLTANAQRPAVGGKVAVQTEDCAAVTFETDQGALGSVVLSQVTHGRKNRLWFSIDGAEASLCFDQEVPESLWVGRRQQNTVILRGSVPTGPDVDRYNVLPAGHPQGYQDCFNAFVTDVYVATAGQAPDGLPTFVDGHRAAVLTTAVLESAASGQWKEIPQ